MNRQHQCLKKSKSKYIPLFCLSHLASPHKLVELYFYLTASSFLLFSASWQQGLTVLLVVANIDWSVLRFLLLPVRFTEREIGKKNILATGHIFKVYAPLST